MAPIVARASCLSAATYAAILTHFPVQQIKRNLIEKAKLKKDYAKQKALTKNQPPTKSSYSAPEETSEPEAQSEQEPEAPSDTEPQQPAQQPEPQSQQESHTTSNLAALHPSRRAKIIPFAKEHRAAQRQKREAEARRIARETAARERAEKLEEREKFRKAMAKARSGGKNGQRKLGRESGVLLDRIRKMVKE